MTDFLIKRFIKDSENVSDRSVRESYGVLSGAVGIVLNIFLSALKFVLGIVSKSVSVMADAANNLSDAASSVVTLLGSKISSKPADEKHPYGHGRVEYISAFIVSCIIFIMGFELLISSVKKIVTPETAEFSAVTFAALLISIPVKLWMAYFNNKIAKKIKSLSAKAVVTDSLSDCITTFSVAVCLLISKFTGYNIDGFAGLLVSFLIIRAGFDIINDVISSLMGSMPDPALVSEIEETVLSHKGIVGVHDLMVHDYGPGRVICSIHAEVPAEQDITVSHDIIDNAEEQLMKKFGIMATIHLDPVETKNEKVLTLKKQVKEIVKDIDPEFSIHDFRIVRGNTHTNVLFDVVIPFDCKKTNAEISEKIKKCSYEISSDYYVIAKIEHKFTR